MGRKRHIKKKAALRLKGKKMPVVSQQIDIKDEVHNGKIIETKRTWKDLVLFIIAIVGCVLGVYNTLQAVKNNKITVDVSVIQKVNEAWDYLGGQPGTYTLRLNSARYRGDLEMARRRIEEAMILDNKSGRVWFAYGVYLSELERHEEAIDAYRYAIELSEDKANIYSNIALSLDAMGDYKAALIEHNRAIALKPKVGKYYQCKAISYRKLGDTDSAEWYVKKSIDLKTTDLPSAYNEWGLCYLDKYLYSDARKYFEKALDLDSNHAQARFNLGLAQYNAGDYEGAYNSFLWSVKVDSMDFVSMRNVANSLLKLNAPGRAQAYLKKLLVYDEKDIDARYLLGMTYEMSANDSMALVQYDMLMKQKIADSSQVQERIELVRARMKPRGSSSQY